MTDEELRAHLTEEIKRQPEPKVVPKPDADPVLPEVIEGLKDCLLCLSTTSIWRINAGYEPFRFVSK
jgi:hypothetical protein